MLSTRKALVVALLVPLAACGSRWDTAQKKEIAARHQRALANGEQVTPSEGDGTRTQQGPGAQADPGDSDSVPANTPAGAKTPSRIATSALPCAAPSTAPGVTASEITVGAISSLSGPVPGLAAASAGATRAYVAYRNATGGICGRRIVLKEADDGTDNGRFRAVVTELAPNILGLAGGFAVGDIGGIDVIERNRLPMVSLPSSQRVSVLPTVFDINPPFGNPDVVIGKYKYLYDHGVRKAAVSYIEIEQSRNESDLHTHLMKAAGIQVVLTQAIPLSQLSYDSTARAVANSGADYSFFIGDDHGDAAMSRALRDSGYKALKFIENYVYAYETSFVAQAGDAAEGTSTWLRALPNEDAATNKEKASMLQWMDRVAPGDNQNEFAADAWASTKAFFDTLEKLSGPITRDAFVAKLRAIDIFEGDGMFGPIKFGQELNQGCTVGLIYEKGKWRRIAPASGFLC